MILRILERKGIWGGGGGGGVSRTGRRGNARKSVVGYCPWWGGGGFVGQGQAGLGVYTPTEQRRRKVVKSRHTLHRKGRASSSIGDNTVLTGGGGGRGG